MMRDYHEREIAIEVGDETLPLPVVCRVEIFYLTPAHIIEPPTVKLVEVRFSERHVEVYAQVDYERIRHAADPQSRHTLCWIDAEQKCREIVHRDLQNAFASFGAAVGFAAAAARDIDHGDEISASPSVEGPTLAGSGDADARSVLAAPLSREGAETPSSTGNGRGCGAEVVGANDSGGVDGHAGVATREATEPVVTGGLRLCATDSKAGSSPASHSRNQARPAVTFPDEPEGRAA